MHVRQLARLAVTQTLFSCLPFRLSRYQLGGRSMKPWGSAKSLDCVVKLSTSSPSERIDDSYLIEEETLSTYRAKDYYPVKLGQIFQDRYRIIGKLGFGTASTVWLCRDLQKQHEYVALKIYINNSKYHRELPIYEEIKELQTAHSGQRYIRKMYDSFELQGPNGTHICLAHQPLSISLGELKELTEDRLFSSEFVRQTLRCILTGLQFLHKEVRVIHTGELIWSHLTRTL